MLGLPHAFSTSGWVLGLVLIAFFGCASAFGSHLLHCSARRIGTAPCSFYSVSSQVVPRWTWLIDGAVAVKCFGVGTSYIIIVGDLLPDALHSMGIDIGRRTAILVGFCIAGPLATLKNLSALRYTATVAVTITLWTAIMIVLFYLRAGAMFEPCAGEDLPCNGEPWRMFPESSSSGFLEFGKTLPVFIFTFTCQQNVFTVCNEVRNASKTRMDRVVQSAYSTAGFIFALAAFFGFATFGAGIESNVLKGYPKTGAVEFTRVAYSILVVFSYPLQAHPSRASILALVRMVKPLPPRQEGAGEGGDENIRFWVVTACFLSLSLTVALLLDDLGVVLEIVGATGSTMVSYILPGLVYVRAFPEQNLKRAFAWNQLIMGCIIMPTCLTMIFVKI